MRRRALHGGGRRRQGWAAAPRPPRNTPVPRASLEAPAPQQHSRLQRSSARARRWRRAGAAAAGAAGAQRAQRRAQRGHSGRSGRSRHGAPRGLGTAPSPPRWTSRCGRCCLTPAHNRPHTPGGVRQGCAPVCARQGGAARGRRQGSIYGVPTGRGPAPYVQEGPCPLGAVPPPAAAPPRRAHLLCVARAVLRLIHPEAAEVCGRGLAVVGVAGDVIVRLLGTARRRAGRHTVQARHIHERAVGGTEPSPLPTWGRAQGQG